MEPIDFLLTRRSVSARLLGPPGPDAAALELILRAATRVPDHGKLTPWRIQVLREEGQRRLGELLAGLYAAETPGARESQIETERQRPQRAPVLLVVTSKARGGHKIPEIEQILSGANVCFSILLATRAVGFAANWLTEWPAYHPEVIRALGHDPALDRILGFLYLGSPTELPADRPRPALDEVVGEWTGERSGAADGEPDAERSAPAIAGRAGLRHRMQ